MCLNNILIMKSEFVIRMDGDNGFLMNCVNGDVYEINSTTQIILKECNGNNTLSDIFKILYNNKTDEEFEVVEEDIIEMAEFFVTNGICDIKVSR